MDELVEDAAYILSMDAEERFAYFSPYIKLCAEPTEVYLQMLANAGVAGAEELVGHADFLNKCELISEKVPENKRLGEVHCYSYCFLINSKLYHSKNADISIEWDKIKGIIKRYGYQEAICKNSMKAAHDYMITLIQKNNLNLLRQLTEFVEEIYSHCHIVEIADVAAGYQ